jgi:hypothetical protein
MQQNVINKNVVHFLKVLKSIFNIVNIKWTGNIGSE